MHTFLVIIVVIVAVPAVLFFSPRGPLTQRANRWAWRRNAEGRGNVMTKPIWGKRARPPRGFDEPDKPDK